MASLRFSGRARQDLRDIAAYTISKWGKDQADRYLDQIEMFAKRLADESVVGRPCEDIRPGLRRAKCGSHVLYFRRSPSDGVLICRILHKRMLATGHPIEDEGR